MQIDNPVIRKVLAQGLLDVFIRVGLIVFVVVMCARVISPFVNLAMWSVILAIALYPLQQKLAARMGGRQGRASTVLVLSALLLIGVPTAMLGSSFATQAHKAYTAFEDGTLELRPPKPSVAEWPLVGDKIYRAWTAAATDLPAYVHDNQAELRNLAKRLLSAAATTAGSVMSFLGSLIIAGVIMAYGQGGSQAMRRIIGRFSGTRRGGELQTLITATVRSVASGVIGVAFIQALLLGVGFIMAGVPAAGILAMVVMVLGILQLPALLLTIPVIIYLWTVGDGSATMNVVFSVYLLVAGMADNVLKPLLLGRGVDAPMPVILLGALGGMVTGGIVGLFVGAVLLAVGYQLFMDWVAHTDDEESEAPVPAGSPGVTE